VCIDGGGGAASSRSGSEAGIATARRRFVLEIRRHEFWLYRVKRSVLLSYRLVVKC
jgi:hypothetical protein